MTDDQSLYLNRAQGRLRIAGDLLDADQSSVAVEAAAHGVYYAMFYVATAYLLGTETTVKSHRALTSKFGEHFARPGMATRPFHRHLITAFDARNAGDYALIPDIDEAKVRTLHGHAVDFLALARGEL